MPPQKRFNSYLPQTQCLDRIRRDAQIQANKTGIDLSDFIRAAVEEKLQREYYPTIAQSTNNQSGDNQ